MLSRCRPLLGTFVEITADREAAIELAFAAADQVHRLMSAHDPMSDVSLINRFAQLRAVDVHEWTARVISRASFWSKRSEGAFDVVRAGKAALESGYLPRHPDQPLPEAAHWTSLEIRGASVRLLMPGCIDLGGIAKGFAVDRAVDALRVAGCARGLVNAGGDLRGFGRAPWLVSVVHPLTRSPVAAIEVDNVAMATSAGLPREGDQLNFDHLGVACSSWLSATVLARTACDADALTKIVWAGDTNIGMLLADAGANALALTTAGEIERLGELAEVAT
jgi:thiamine biosynthesis lipoprotein